LKTKAKISGYVVRGAAVAGLSLSALVTLGSAFNLPNSLLTSAVPLRFSGNGPGTLNQARTLSFAERVTYQLAIEDVYWHHRIWPKDNPNPKPSLDAVISQAELENKVQDYLRDSEALEDYWHRPITAEQLQAEMDRMVQDTKQPEVLRELFEALENDPFVIAECLARPVLTERLLNNQDERMDGGQGQRTEVGLKESSLVNAENQMPDTVTVPNSGYSLPSIAAGANGCFDDTWTATAIAPFRRDSHTAVWTGTEMIVWGGAYTGATEYQNTGGRYNPSTDSWTATSTVNAPSGRWGHNAVWTGSKMIIWGGADSSGINNTGARYNPVTNNWTPTSTTNAPAPGFYTAVWSGSEMIVWGGPNGGGKYNPNTNSWTAISNINAPTLQSGPSAVWAGSEMIVWGGSVTCQTFYQCETNTGARYNPTTNSWTATSTANAPIGRYGHTAVWTGNEMLVWGGINDDGPFTIVFNDGGKYNPSTNSWAAISSTNAPSQRTGYTAVWTGGEMIIWGGNGAGGGNGDWGSLNTGGKYSPENGWTATSTTHVTTARDGHTAVWTGSEMIVWGGDYNDGVAFPLTLRNGGRYCVATGPPVVTTNPATNITSLSATLNGSLNPNGLTTTVYFEYGPTTSYGFVTPVQIQAGNTLRNLSANISGLSASTTYHFRIVAINSAGTTHGNDRTFTTLSPTGPPVVTTNLATLIAGFSATLNGSVNPHGLTTTVYFQYGPTTSYGSTAPVQTQTGNTFRNISRNISGLSASTTYHFQIVAINSAGTRYGSDRRFTTLSATGSPVVTTNLATFIASFSAKLNGSLDPHGLNTTVYFEYGTTTSYGFSTALQSETGNTYRNITANINGLSANTTYHFRIVATNSAGTRRGGDKTFTTLSTGPPVVSTVSATNVESSSATLNGFLNPNGLTTTFYFEYGTTTSYGFSTAHQSATGNTYRLITANINGLSAGTTYHFRIVATNIAGARVSIDRTFTTP
jgi:N-acetylneuraminic acid mutarotase